MEIANLIKDLIIAFLWPTFAFFLVIKFKSEISSLLKKMLKMDKLNYKDWSAEFNKIEIHEVEKNAKLITDEIFLEQDKDIQNRLDKYLAKYAIIEKVKLALIEYLDKYGSLSRDVAYSLMSSNIKSKDNPTEYIDIAISIMEKQGTIRLNENLILRK